MTRKALALKPQFDELRATQAAAFLLRLAGGRCNSTALLKLLYLSDRESLTAVGAAITGASFVNVRNGPMASDVYDCIKGDGPCSIWGEHVRTEGYDVIHVLDPGDGELSDFDVATLERLFARCGSKSHLELIDVVRALPEWSDPGGKPASLAPEDIMRAAGVDDATIQAWAERNHAVSKFITT